MVGSKAPVIIGVCSLAVGGLAFLGENSNHNVCNSVLGEIARGFDAKTDRSCALDNGIWIGGIALMITGGVSLGAAGILANQGHGPMPPPPPQAGPGPGWYPDPWNPRQKRWWDGHRWTDFTSGS